MLQKIKIQAKVIAYTGLIIFGIVLFLALLAFIYYHVDKLLQKAHVSLFEIIGLLSVIAWIVFTYRMVNSWVQKKESDGRN